MSSRGVEPSAAFATSDPSENEEKAVGSPASPGLRAIVDAIVPEGDAAGVRSRAVTYAAEFTALQLFTAPAPLRWLARIGVTAFLAATVLRFATTIARLEPARRRKWVDAWAYGPLPPARLLFRGIRSNALLAYFEVLDLGTPQVEVRRQ